MIYFLKPHSKHSVHICPKYAAINFSPVSSSPQSQKVSTIPRDPLSSPYAESKLDPPELKFTINRNKMKEKDFLNFPPKSLIPPTPLPP